MTSEILDSAAVEKRLNDELPQWKFYAAESSIRRAYSTSGWKSSMMIANAVGFLAEAGWHHPEMAIEYSTVKINLTTHSVGGVTEKDLVLAKRIEGLVCCYMDEGVLKPPPEKFALLKPGQIPD